MSLLLHKADAFVQDFALQALWYVREGGEGIARRFLSAVDARLKILCEQPSLGRPRHFRNPRLQRVRSLPLERPFQRFLIFYREEGDTLEALRLMEGSCDLPRRLDKSPVE